MKLFKLAATCALLWSLAGCSEPAPKKKVEVKPPVPVTGRFALFQMYGPARAWAPDVQPLRLNSIDLPEVKAERGKAPAWQVYFVSAQSGRARAYTYSVVESAGNLHKGVFAGLEESWSGPRGVNKPFLLAAIKIDSDDAYREALKKGAQYDKKNPGKPITFLLDEGKKYPSPTWRVIWGESVGTSNFSILVDASTGLYLETMR